MSDDQPRKATAYLPISRYLLDEVEKTSALVRFGLGTGPDPFTPEQREEHRRRREARLERQQVFIDRLAVITDDVASAVLALHSPRHLEHWPECEGCDYAGYEGEPPDWPCRTVRLIADRHGVEVPE